MREISKEGEGDDEHRHRCLVRYIIRWRIKDRDAVYKWFNGYTDENGRYQKGWDQNHEGSILRRDVVDQWKKGNRGENNEWLS
jgi:hypothetical protein